MLHTVYLRTTEPPYILDKFTITMDRIKQKNRNKMATLCTNFESGNIDLYSS